ncbi:hypothetical protein DL93DRAFT_2226627 [Clavulina sp. PMI_390]|nr:hypothetical protein DL93DRAFT_2226627 [Clavulina sp. PMI_390]
MSAADVDMFGSDDDAGAPEPTPQKSIVDQDMEDLFGDEDDDDEKENASRASSSTPSALPDSGLSAAERKARQALEYEEEDREAPPVIAREADAVVPNIPLPRSSDGNIWIARMPNFVKIDSQPFSPETYRGPEADVTEDQLDTIREQSLSIKLEVDNTVRWRWAKGPDGKLYRQSNSRIIRWSDGTMSLQLGNEIFDVTVNVDTSGSVPRAGGVTATNTQGSSQSQSIAPTPSRSSQPSGSSNNLNDEADASISKPYLGHKGLSYLAAQHQESSILQVESPVTGFVTFRPTGMQSETHRKLVRAVGQKHSKVARLRLAPDNIDSQGTNPQAQKGKRKSRASGAVGSVSRRSTAYDDDDSDGGFDRVSARRKSRSSIRGSRASKFAYSDDDSDEPAAAYGDDDDDDGSPRKRKLGATPKKPRGPPNMGGEYEADDFLVDDDPSDDDGDDDGTSKRRRAEEDVDDEPDFLDKVDRDIEDQAKKRRKDAKASGLPASTADDDVDVESEGMDMSQDESEQAPRSGNAEAASQTKKPQKRIIMEDDDDE